MPNLASLQYGVAGLCDHVGAFIRQEAATFDTSKVEHKGFNDLVSYVDKTAEQQLVAGLQKLLPEAGFIAEEGTVDDRDKDWVWIIDPLDGTTNFTHGLPPYAISVALAHQHVPVLGVVYEVGADEMYAAAQGQGAFCNGKPIHVAQNTALSEALMATGFPYNEFAWLESYMGVLQAFMKETHGVRRFGSAATDLSYVALGRFDGFFEYGLKPWDVAAGGIIVKEAGGVVTDFQGGNDWVFGGELLAGSQLHPKMLEIVKARWVFNK